MFDTPNPVPELNGPERKGWTRRSMDRGFPLGVSVTRTKPPSQRKDPETMSLKSSRQAEQSTLETEPRSWTGSPWNKSQY